jgi:hypothetical protein
MRNLYTVLLGAATITAPALGAGPESTVTGSAATIRSVVSGKACVGEDTPNVRGKCSWLAWDVRAEWSRDRHLQYRLRHAC